MKDITLKVGISCVDGAEETLETDEVERVVSFLQQRDHEGSSICLVVEVNNELAYKLLRALDEGLLLKEN